MSKLEDRSYFKNWDKIKEQIQKRANENKLKPLLQRTDKFIDAVNDIKLISSGVTLWEYRKAYLSSDGWNRLISHEYVNRYYKNNKLRKVALPTKLVERIDLLSSEGLRDIERGKVIGLALDLYESLLSRSE